MQEVAQESWQQYKTNNDSLLVDLFGFLEKSKLTCTRCGEVSIHHLHTDALRGVDGIWGGQSSSPQCLGVGGPKMTFPKENSLGQQPRAPKPTQARQGVCWLRAGTP